MPLTGSLAKHSVSDLLSLYSRVMRELEVRKVARTANNPAGNYAEWLAAKALRLDLATNSTRYDAEDAAGRRYEIKGVRRTTYDVAVLFSGDSDFKRVLEILQSRGKRVFVVSSRNSVSRELIHAADKPVFFMEDFRELLERNATA